VQIVFSQRGRNIDWECFRTGEQEEYQDTGTGEQEE